jgi:hypothetical protein
MTRRASGFLGHARIRAVTVSRTRFQFTLGTLLALIAAFAILCSYITIIGPAGLLELGSSAVACVAACIVVLLLAALLYLPCRVALWVLRFDKRWRQPILTATGSSNAIEDAEKRTGEMPASPRRTTKC